MVIRRIQHLGNHFCHSPLLHGFHIFTRGKQVHIQILGAVRVPQPQGIHLQAVISRDQHIPRHSNHGLIPHMLSSVVTAFIPVGPDIAAKANFHSLVIMGNQPTLRRQTPVIGHFRLPAVPDHLAEDSQFVADGISRCIDSLRSHRIHITGRQSAQTAIAQTGIRLRIKYIRRMEPQILQGLTQRLPHAQVIGIFQQGTANQKLHGQVVHLFSGDILLMKALQAAHQFPDDHGTGLKHLVSGCLLAGDREIGVQLILNGTAHFIGGNIAPIHSSSSVL